MNALKRIHINKPNGAPKFAVRTYKQVAYGSSVLIEGPCTMFYKPKSPLSCGATVWIETRGRVEVLDAKKKEVLE